MNGSMGRTVKSCIAHNIASAEEKVDTLKSERLMYEDLSGLSIRSVSSAVGRPLVPWWGPLAPGRLRSFFFAQF
jgi:hypothetical protein